MICENCNHHDFDHYTVADTPTDADGKPNLPKGTIIPCDVTLANGKQCGCIRYIPRRKGMRYRVEVIADNSGKWCGNQLTFPTKEKAEEYARDLTWRWTAVRDWRVVETEESCNESH